MENANDIKFIIAANIARFRRLSKMTQLELADKLNYTDKAVSKWERGDSLPDITVLVKIASVLNITIDDLIRDNKDDSNIQIHYKRTKRAKTLIPLLSVGVAWLVATIAFVILSLIPETATNGWLSFIFAMPVSLIVFLVFNSIWGKKIISAVVISALIWTTILSIVLVCTFDGRFMLFLIGIPLQILVALWYVLRIKGKKDKSKPDKS